MAMYNHTVWLQENQQFRKYNKSHILIIMSLHCDLDLEVSSKIFLPDTLADDEASRYQAYLGKVQLSEVIIQTNIN